MLNSRPTSGPRRCRDTLEPCFDIRLITLLLHYLTACAILQRFTGDVLFSYFLHLHGEMRTIAPPGGPDRRPPDNHTIIEFVRDVTFVPQTEVILIYVNCQNKHKHKRRTRKSCSGMGV